MTSGLFGRDPEYRTIEPAQRAAAKVVGAVYLLAMATGVFGQVYVRGRLIVPDDAARSAQNVLGAERLFRLSIAGDLLTYIMDVALIWGFYVLVRRVNRNVALLAVFFRVIETAVLCAGTVNSLVLLRALQGADSVQAFSASQRQSIAALALSTQGFAMSVGFVLLGLGSAIFAYLLLESGYVPRALPAWGIFSSLLLAIVTLAILVFPRLWGAVGLAYMMPMGVYEVGLGLWLLVKGIRAPVAGSRTAVLQSRASV